MDAEIVDEIQAHGGWIVTLSTGREIFITVEELNMCGSMEEAVIDKLGQEAKNV